MNRRASGILIHITSLPSPYGIGDLGPWAYRFADFLAQTGQSYWQILPLNPTSTGRGNSPYSSYSAFAGNLLLISPDLLIQDSLLTRKELENIPAFSTKRVDYKAVTEYKMVLLHKAYQRCRDRLKSDYEFQWFCHEQRGWLEDYALFVALNEQFGGSTWNKWPEKVRDRNRATLKGWESKLKDRIGIQKFVQYLFFKQWSALRDYCHRKSIQIIGDLPIYVYFHSADVWANPDLFRLDPRKNPTVVAGIPPDYFSSTGQLWGNPIYRWEVLKERGYEWWVRRVAHNMRFFDTIRLDHFMGFVHYWEVPANHKTAENGRWQEGPREHFFDSLLKHFAYLPFIAEDLGVITADIRELRDRFDLPGMRVLQFAFGNDPLADFYKPHHYIPNCVAYTGTHDNDTLISWISGDRDHSTRKPSEIRKEREQALRYLGPRKIPQKEVHWEFIRVLMMSAANTVIIPMQDLLGLKEEGRMNRPATAEGNWEWRLVPGQLTQAVKTRLTECTLTYGRA